jgi:uncharacterized protein YkwD
MTAKIKSHPKHIKGSHKHRPKGVSSHSFEKVYWPYIPLLAIAFLLVGASAINGQLKTALNNQFQGVLSYATSLSQQNLLKDTNADRLAANKQPLKLNAQLTKAAQAKANDMALRNYWSHNTPAGNPPWVFVTAANYSYDKLGENLAAGFTDAQATINGWMASPEHKENMLDGDYSEVGFGFANNPNYTSTGTGGPMTVVVAFYGRPAAVASSLDQANAVALASASSNLSSGTPASASAGGVTLARLPYSEHYSSYSRIILISILSAGIGLWIGRHFLALKRKLVDGESFVRAHPLFDLGIVVFGVALWTLTRSVGLIQ